jgi:predicted amidohydrolase
VKLALYQFAPRRGRPEENAASLEAALRAADADVLIAPELATTGYLYLDRAELAAVAEPVPTGPTTLRLARACDETRRAIHFGIAERDGDRIYNSSAFLTPGGGCAVYRKAHLFDTETLVFDRAGASTTIVEAAGARFGLMICFDWRFPETARLLALRGAEILSHPSNLVHPHCQDAMITRALENRVFAATANRFGVETVGGVTVRFSGRSQVVSPRGERLLAMGPEEEGIAVVAIDPSVARDKHVTPRNDVFADRRVDLWDGLLDAAPMPPAAPGGGEIA